MSFDRSDRINLARRLLLAASTGALLPGRGFARDAWPDKPIRLIVPFAPGGSNDNIARLLAQKLSARLGQGVIVDNRGGAGGTIGTDMVAKATPNGNTLLFASTSLTTNAAVGKKLPYDPVKDLEPIGEIGAGPFAIVVSNALKVNTLSEFIELARQKPKTILYGSAGVGGLNHMGTELFASVAKIQMVHVPYKGIGPAFLDLMSGSLQMLLPSLASVLPQLKAGKMKALAVTGAQRSPLAPEIPSTTEAGLPGFQLEVWWGLLGPAQMPAAVTSRLNEELNAILALPDVKKLLDREAADPRPGTPEAFRNLIGNELTRWTRLVRDNHIQVE